MRFVEGADMIAYLAAGIARCVALSPLIRRHHARRGLCPFMLRRSEKQQATPGRAKPCNRLSASMRSSSMMRCHPRQPSEKKNNYI